MAKTPKAFELDNDMLAELIKKIYRQKRKLSYY
jgi:hypothetical protein